MNKGVRHGKAVQIAHKAPPHGHTQVKPSPQAPPKAGNKQPPKVSPKPGHKPSPHRPTGSAPKAGQSSSYQGPVLTNNAKHNHLIAKAGARRSSAVHTSKPPVIKPMSIDGLIKREVGNRDEINKKTKNFCIGFDFEKHGKMDGIRAGYPTLVRVTNRVAQLTGVPFNYLIASLYAESHLRTSAVNKDSGALGIAQIMPITWKELKRNKDEYKNFKDLWSQIAPGVKLPSGPMQSPVGDILFLAVWTLHRENEFPQMKTLNEREKNMARRLSYKLGDENTRKFVGILCRDHKVTLGKAAGSWEAFMEVLDAAAPGAAQAKK